MSTTTETAAPSSAAGITPVPENENNTWWHLFFGGLMAVTLVTFSLWAHDYVGENASLIVLLTTIIFAVFMAFNIGGNDVANSFGTSVGAGTLSLKQALVVAAIFEVSGAVLAGGEVTDTVRSGIVDLGAIDNLEPMNFAYIMMASLLGAAVWLLVATRMGWPVFHRGRHRWCGFDRRLHHRHWRLVHGPVGRGWQDRHFLGSVSGTGRHRCIPSLWRD